MTSSSDRPSPTLDGGSRAVRTGKDLPLRVADPREAPRLLVISYHFPPGEGVGALRWGGLTKYLARQGWQVAVVSAFGNGSFTHPPSVRVEGCPPRAILNDRYLEWKASGDGSSPEARRIGDPSPSPDGEAPRRLPAADVPRRVLRELGGLLSWPDEGRGWLGRALRAARDLVREFEPDVIVSSGPPHSAHVVAGLARGRRSCPWFQDLRDPWAWGPGPTVFSEQVFRRTERLVLPRATGVVVTAPELRTELSRRYPNMPVHWIPNGVDRELLPTARVSPYPGLSVVHLGSLYRGRDPGPILDGFARFLEEVPDAREAGSALRFVGRVEREFAPTIDRWASRSLRGHVEKLPPVPREEALRMLQRSSVAVVLAQGQWDGVPAKLYESVAMGIPTLVIAERGSATYRTAARLGAFRAEPSDPGGMALAFKRVWVGEGPPEPRGGQPVDYDDLARRMGALFAAARHA